VERKDHHGCQCHYVGEHEKKKRNVINNSKQSDDISVITSRRDANKSIADADKLVVASNVVNKVIEVDVGEDQSLSNVNIKQTLEVEML
jgi:vacuolar-type H+-ATPase subunit F/Vma7